MEDSNIVIDKDVHFVLWVSVVKSIHESELADCEIHIQPRVKLFRELWEYILQSGSCS